MKCINEYLIIKPDKQAEKTKGGLQVADVPQNEVAIWTGTVVECDRYAEGVHTDDKVIYSKAMAQRYVKDSEELAVVKYEDVIAVESK